MNVTNLSASARDSIFRILAIFLRWMKAGFVTYVIWFSKDRLMSNVTPRSLTVEHKIKVHPSKC